MISDEEQHTATSVAYLDAEHLAATKVLKAMRVPPKQVRLFLNDNLINSVSLFNDRLAEEIYGNFSMSLHERSFDIVALVVTYMNIHQFPSFLSITESALLDMQQTITPLLPEDESLLHFYDQVHMMGADGCMLHLRHGISDYVSLYQHLPVLRTAGLSGVNPDIQFLMWKCLNSMPPPVNVGLLEDPIGDFLLRVFLRNEMHTLLSNFGFTESDMDHVSFELTYCSYHNLIKHDYDFKAGAGQLGLIPVERRNLLRRAVLFMERSMKNVPKELRISQFDFMAFRRTQHDSETLDDDDDRSPVRLILY